MGIMLISYHAVLNNSCSDCSSMGVVCIADLSYIVAKRKIEIYECPLHDAVDVVDVVTSDSAFRSLSIEFIGYNADKNPMVEIEVVFAVKL
jgi:hypothetical protein